MGQRLQSQKLAQRVLNFETIRESVKFNPQAYGLTERPTTSAEIQMKTVTQGSYSPYPVNSSSPNHQRYDSVQTLARVTNNAESE